MLIEFAYTYYFVMFWKDPDNKDARLGILRGF